MAEKSLYYSATSKMSIAEFATSEIRLSNGDGLPHNVLARFGLSAEKPERITETIANLKPIATNSGCLGFITPSAIVITDGKAEIHMPTGLPSDLAGRTRHELEMRAKAEETKVRLRKKLAARKAGH